MKRKLFCLVIPILCIYTLTANIQSAKAAAPDETLANIQPALKIVFQDEFNDTTLNAAKWMDQLQWGRTNGSELQYYATNAFSFSNGALHITAQKKSADGKPYTSGALITYKSFAFTYGVVQIRARTPSGQGLWPALWLLDYAGGAQEIDMMELLGNEPNVVYMTLHYPSLSGNQDPGTYFKGPNFSTGYHIFQVDWNASRIIWSVDGVERYRQTSHIPSKPMYLIMNLAVGGDWPGSPDSTTKFPATFDIDYVRIYK